MKSKNILIWRELGNRSSKDISIERKQYLNKLKMQKIQVLLVQVLILVGFLLVWEFLANQNIIDSFITSQPSRIIKTFMNLSQNDLLKHIWVTTYETVIGFLIGTVLGIFIAILLWWSKFLSKVSEPFLVVLNSLPKVALRACYYNLGRSGDPCYYSDGCSNITYCNYT